MDRTGQRITIAIIDDHPVVVEGIRSWIAGGNGANIDVVAVGDTLDAGWDNPDGRCDVLLLDLNLHGTDVTDRIPRLSAAGQRVIVFSQDTDPATILAVLDAGACAYLAKHEGREHCVDTILAVAADQPYVTPSVAGAMVSDRRPAAPQLSVKEREALRLWFQGMPKASVARRMNITEHTVKQYIDRARVKYARAGRQAPTTFALLARAIEDGLIRPAEIGDYRSHAAGPDTG